MTQSCTAHHQLCSIHVVCPGTAGSKAKRSTAEAPKKSAKKQRTRSKAEEAAELACVPEDSVSGREDVSTRLLACCQVATDT